MNWDYMAGFFDGEGSVCCYTGNKDKKQSDRVVVSIGQKLPNGNVIKQLHSFLVDNGINANYRLDATYQMEYVTISDKNDVKLFLNRMSNYCVCKYQDIISGLTFVDTLPNHTRNFTDDEILVIVKMYMTYDNYDTIAKIVGCSSNKIYQWLKRNCLIRSPRSA